jgi:glycosyltransferase involved in cell wall biosynthesis
MHGSGEDHRPIVVGIDGSNLRAGGGVTHLRQLLSAASPESVGIRRVVVWANSATGSLLPDQPWLDVVRVPLLDETLERRVYWQQVVLPRAARAVGCHVVFSPGGRIPAWCRVPRVTMCRNMLPWDTSERRRFGVLSPTYWKLLLLRPVQTWSFRHATAVIFLTEYARNAVTARARVAKVCIIPHGVEERFFGPQRRLTAAPTPSRPFRLLYVSPLAPYKHQQEVMRAVARLRSEGFPLVLELVGGTPFRGYARRVIKDTKKLDPGGEFLLHRGSQPFAELHQAYERADGFVFASSCENLPNTLLEAMAAGLPIACSDRGPMREVLCDGGLYFDPDKEEEILGALRLLLESEGLREEFGAVAQSRARAFTWERCADLTFRLLASVAQAG